MKVYFFWQNLLQCDSRLDRSTSTMAKSIACLLVVLLGRGCSFVPRLTQHHVMLAHYSTADPQIFLPTALDLTLLKSDLVKLCCRSPKASLKELQTMVQEVEGMGEQLGFGQCSSSNGLLSGEWWVCVAIVSKIWKTTILSHISEALPGNSCIPPRMSHEVHRFSGPSARRFPSRPTKSSASLIIYRRPSKKLGQHFK